MKKSIIFLIAIILLLGSTYPVRAEQVTFDEFPSSPSTQIVAIPYFEDPLTEEYSNKGIHFSSGAATPIFPEVIQVIPDFKVWGGDVFTFGNWLPNSYFPVLLPTSQYLGLSKDQGETTWTGIVIDFNHPCRHLAFETRRPGSNTSRITNINVVFFNTEISELHNDSKAIKAYVDPFHYDHTIPGKDGYPPPVDEDGDGWIPYSWDADTGLAAFNRVLLYSDKKFALENLTYYEQWDFNLDEKVDGSDLVEFINASFHTDGDNLASFADRFGATQY
ncbi:MAG: hypothetical protein GY699_18420 [Desulfobacteraceae bacterium]|nr:hypothetical protein [Desulfobacteraceae bacterium]